MTLKNLHTKCQLGSQKCELAGTFNLVPRAFFLSWVRGEKALGKGPGNEVVELSNFKLEASDCCFQSVTTNYFTGNYQHSTQVKVISVEIFFFFTGSCLKTLSNFCPEKCLTRCQRLWMYKSLEIWQSCRHYSERDLSETVYRNCFRKVMPDMSP